MDRLFRRMLWSCVVGASGLNAVARAEDLRPSTPSPRPSAESRLAAIEAEMSALLQKLRQPAPADPLDLDENAPALLPESPLPRATLPAAVPSVLPATAVPADMAGDLFDFEDPFDDAPIVATQYQSPPQPAPAVPPVPSAPSAFEPESVEQRIPKRVASRAVPAPDTPASRAERLKRLEQEISALKATRPATESSEDVARDVPADNDPTIAPQSSPSQQGAVAVSASQTAADAATPAVVTSRPLSTPAPAPQRRSTLPASPTAIDAPQITPRESATRPARPAAPANVSPGPNGATNNVRKPVEANDAVITRLQRLERELDQIRQERIAKKSLREQAAQATPAPSAASEQANAEEDFRDPFDNGPQRPATPARRATRVPEPTRSTANSRSAAASAFDPFVEEPVFAPPSPPAKPASRIAAPTAPRSEQFVRPIAPTTVARQDPGPNSTSRGDTAPSAAPAPRVRATARPTVPPAQALPNREASSAASPVGQSPAHVFPTRRIPATQNEIAPSPPDPRLSPSQANLTAPVSAAPQDATATAHNTQFTAPNQPTEDSELVGASGEGESTDASSAEDESASVGSGTSQDSAGATKVWKERRESLVDKIQRARQSRPHTTSSESHYATRTDAGKRSEGDGLATTPGERPKSGSEPNSKGATIAPAPPADPPPVRREPRRSPNPADSLGPSTTTPPETLSPTTSPESPQSDPTAAPSPLPPRETAGSTPASPSAPGRIVTAPRNSSSHGMLFSARDVDNLFGGGNGGFYAGYDLLMLQPRFENSEGLVITPVAGLTSSKNFDFDYELSPRFFAGMAFDSGFGFRFQGWQFDHGTRISELSAAAGGVRTPAISPSGAAAPLVLAAGAGDELRAEHSLQFQAYDLEATWQQMFRRSAMTIAGGVRYLHMEQQYDVQRINGAGAITGTLRHDHDFEGVGPTVAAEWLCPFGESGLSFFAGGRGSILIGSRNQVATLVAGGVTQDFNIDQPGHVGIGEAGLGLQYSSGALTVRGGYEGQIWTDVGSATSRTGNMGLHGFSASIGFSY